MNWKAKPLGSCIEVFDSCRRPVTKKDRVLGPYPYYGASGIVDYVDSYIFEGLHVLVAEDGENLRSRKLPIAYLADGRFWVNNHAHVLRANDENDTRFLSYMIESLDLSGFITGSTQPKLSQAALLSIPLRLPKLAEQRRIAELLGTLDNKIESNQNLAEVIPSLIDAKIHHALSDGSGDSIPVSKLAKFVNGGAYTKEASGTGRMVIRIADLNTGPGASTIYNDIDVPGDRLAHFGDLLMSWSGSLGVYVWVREEAIVNQHIFKVILTDFPAWLVHNRLNVALHGFRAIAADKATTMGHIQRKHLDETFVEVPIAKLEQLNHLCVPLWNRFISAQLESMRLAELRDALLPELMSGRMRVDEAGCLVSEALDEEVADV
ncbi:restriction endonuclease subunit S [Xylanimonas cellulosilytica]|jgi:restriction modification system DNA specificity domain protein|uniref:restriction endonuclease subunit S n=1 Tax=Xylanimonas cellulosilytica TaxID=186189 RepID=UPI0009E34379|nr:restriction endonuclease subunit S [Xylanimonas cellulosilytica]